MKYKAIKIMLIVGAVSAVMAMLVHLLCFTVFQDAILNANGIASSGVRVHDSYGWISYAVDTVLMLVLCLVTLLTGKEKVKQAPFWIMIGIWSAFGIAWTFVGPLLSVLHCNYYGPSYLAAYSSIEYTSAKINMVFSYLPGFCMCCAAGATVAANRGSNLRTSGRAFAWTAAISSTVATIIVIIICTVCQKWVCSLFGSYDYEPINCTLLIVQEMICTILYILVAVLTTAGILPRFRWLIGVITLLTIVVVSNVISNVVNTQFLFEGT